VSFYFLLSVWKCFCVPFLPEPIVPMVLFVARLTIRTLWLYASQMKIRLVVLSIAIPAAKDKRMSWEAPSQVKPTRPSPAIAEIVEYTCARTRTRQHSSTTTKNSTVVCLLCNLFTPWAGTVIERSNIERLIWKNLSWCSVLYRCAQQKCCFDHVKRHLSQRIIKQLNQNFCYCTCAAQWVVMVKYFYVPVLFTSEQFLKLDRCQKSPVAMVNVWHFQVIQ